MLTNRLTTTTAAAAVVILAGSAAALAAGDPTPTPPPRIAFVARGDGSNFADALAVGSVAGQLGAPVFTTPGMSLAPATAAALANYGPELVIITGGTAAISADVEADIATATGLAADDVVRAAGTDRYETAGQIAAIFDDHDIDAAFLPVGATATDSDLLDGLDSNAFFRRDGSTSLDGPLTYTTPQQRTLVIPAAAFTSSPGNMSAEIRILDAGDVRGQDDEILAVPVALPDGAVIRAARAHIRDDDLSLDVAVQMVSAELGTDSSTILGLGTSQQTGAQTVSFFSTSHPHTVDNATNTYHVRVTANNEWSPDTWLEGVEISYTITTQD